VLWIMLYECLSTVLMPRLFAGFHENLSSLSTAARFAVESTTAAKLLPGLKT
jgi:hypothetical protein